MTPTMTRLGEQDIQPLIVFRNNQLKCWRPMKVGQKPLLAQDGWLDFGDGMPLVSYDYTQPILELVREDGSHFFWEKGKRCKGHPVGMCDRPPERTWEDYCWYCAQKIEKESMREKRQERAAVIVEEMISSGALPGFFRDWQPPALTQEQAVAVMSAQDHAGCAWIFGDRGRGKTVTGYTLLHNALQRCRRVAYADAGVLTEARRDSVLRATLARADLLMVDDIEKGNLSEWGVEILHSIFDKRHEPRLRTIVTSEHDAGQVNQLLKTACNGRYGNSTIERLNFPKCKCLAIELTGENLRRAQ